ncbi:hypothetical protein [uncultured Croceitalea sp.]|uniref:hypothetical protein n=1 Tax=uncultured Croceitalea sp. TaxID=1798908 RepID=UPI0033068163
MSIINSVKNFLLGTYFAKILRNIQAWILYARIPPLKSGVERKTVYCISPYKTGTTYLARCFSSEISVHEPLHYLSLKLLNKNFDSFFARRMKHLNLKLECSGAWSAYVNELAQNEIAKDLEYICIIRTPSSWVASVINYWNTKLKQYKFEFVNELFWKKKVGVDLFEFQFGMDTKKNQEIIDKLIQFYFDFTKNTSLLKNVTYIKLKEIDKNLPYVENLINEISTTSNSYKNKSKEKLFVYENKSIDADYELLMVKLIEEKNSNALK